MDEKFKEQLQAFLSQAGSAAVAESRGTQCVSDDEILLFARGSLDLIPEKRREIVAKHAGGECGRCTDLVELMKKSQDNYEARKAQFLQAVPVKQRVAHPLRYLFDPLWVSLKRQPIWAWTAMAAALALSFGVPAVHWVWVDFTAPPQPLPGLVEALQRIRGEPPDDPRAIQDEAVLVTRAVVSGKTGEAQIPTPDEVRKIRGIAQAKATKIDEHSKAKWEAADNKLAMLEVFSNYNKLSESKTGQVPLKAVGIETKSLMLADGILQVSSTNPRIQDWNFQSLLADSARQTNGIRFIRISGPDTTFTYPVK